jgi:hypothetical protein
MTSPNPGAYNNLSTTVSSTATLIATVSSDADGILVYNAGSVTVYLGGGTVASSGANEGFPLAASSSVLVPSTGGSPNQLYAITASSTAAVIVLFPSGA